VNRKYIVGAIVAAIVVVGALIAFSLAGGDDDVDPNDLQDVALVQEALGGIPQSGRTLGEPDAPIEITEFGDLQCPACKASSEDTNPELFEKYVATGRAKITFVPIAFLGDDSERGALGAEAAARQDALWPFVEVLYHNQGAENSGWLTEDLMRAVVRELGLDADRWDEDFEGEDVVTSFFEAANIAEEAQVNSTPTFVIEGPRGRQVVTGAQKIGAFDDAIGQVAPE